MFVVTDVLFILADDSYLRTDNKTPKLGKSGCRKLFLSFTNNINTKHILL